MRTRVQEGVIRVLYKNVDGMHLFTSRDVKGLCAGSYDLAEAYDEVSCQLEYIMYRQLGADVSVEPGQPLDTFKQSLEDKTSVGGGLVAQWATTRQTRTNIL